MKSCGVIATYMTRQDWRGKFFWVKLRTILFNLCLFIGQLIFMIVGTAYGKIKWEKALFWVRVLSVAGIIVTTAGIIDAIVGGHRYLFFYFTAAFTFFVCEYRGIEWRRVWRAAQVSHVRLVLEEVDPLECTCYEIIGGHQPGCMFHRMSIEEAQKTIKPDSYWTANFGYPKMEIQPWRIDQCKGQFKYCDPTFETSPEFIAAMIGYAEGEVGKRYDWLQLILGYPANFIVWLFCPWWWGQEKIKWFNLRGGKEVCSSGWVACLRWAYLIRFGYSAESATKMLSEGYAEYGTIFFEGYDTAVVWPCQIAIDENWEVT